MLLAVGSFRRVVAAQVILAPDDVTASSRSVRCPSASRKLTHSLTDALCALLRPQNCCVSYAVNCRIMTGQLGTDMTDSSQDDDTRPAFFP
ncbi:hypothetical protein OH77DRAFT_610185 [Trametes cingulata]|nr:hypothetical protein OH77DRAFT_610185 [Trametes cingulata]